MTKQQVIALLGMPSEETKQFRLGQLAGYEKQYVEARASNSRYFLLWHTGDITCCVGFNEKNIVAYVASGGT